VSDNHNELLGVPCAMPPEDWTVIEAVGVFKCMDPDGHTDLWFIHSDNLSNWEALGMLRTMQVILEDNAPFDIFVDDE
jgi:hypothetical protein